MTTFVEPNDARTGPSRRGFMGRVLLLAGTAIALAGPGGAIGFRVPTAPRARRPVVAFHADRPYLDLTGIAEPYLPPVGLRSLDGVDEDALRHLVYTL